MFKPDVLCIGSATLDNFLLIKPPFSKIKPGDKILVQSLEKHSGGGATNSAAALTKLGLKVKLLTKLGPDHDADFILKELQQYKIKNLCQNKSKKNTDFATIITSLKEKRRIIYVHKGASRDLNPNDFKSSQLKAKWIYLATLIGKSFQTAKQIIEQKKETNLLFNPSLYLAKKGKTYLKPILKHTNILVLNKKEAQALLKTQNPSSQYLLLSLHKLGPQTVVITQGPKTIHALHQNTFYSLKPPKIKLVYPSGAGDAFTSALLAGLIKKYPFQEALKLGQANASSVLRHLGTKNKLLNEEEAQQLIKKLKIKVTSYPI